MNTGIGDAVDLGWKLDASLRGWGGDALLSSYERERRPVALRNVTQSTGNLQRMLSTRQKRPPSDVFETGLEGDAARAIYGAWFTETMRHEWFTLGFHLGYRYDDSPIVWPDGTPAPPEATSTYVQTARPGARAPHLWLADGRSTLDLFGHGFTLLQLGASERHADLLQGAAELRGIPLRVVRLDTPEMLAAYDSRLVLVRPDGHVAWRGNVAPDDPLAVIDVARGARTYADVAEDGFAAAAP
jgi:hypothetical protein